MLIGHHAAAAVVAPLDRPAEFLSRQEQWWVLWIGRSLHAERSAHIAGNQAELMFANLERVFGKAGAKRPWPLMARMNGVAIIA